MMDRLSAKKVRFDDCRSFVVVFLAIGNLPDLAWYRENVHLKMLSYFFPTLRGTASWRSSIGRFLTTVFKDSETVDFDSNSSTVCSKTNTPLNP